MSAALTREVLTSWRAAERDGVSFATWRLALLGKTATAADPLEPFAQPDPALPMIERNAIAGLLSLWRSLRDQTLRVLGLAVTKGAKAAGDGDPAGFSFDALRALAQFAEMEQVFIQAAGSERGPLVQQAFAAWVRGLENAAAEADTSGETQAAIARTRDLMRRTLIERDLELVRNATIRTFRNDIVRALGDGLFDGMNPNEVAQRMRQRFAAKEYDWERLARSETAYAQVSGKQAQYREMGVEKYDYVTANDSRVSAICRRLASGSPYLVGQGPLPMRDSHPNCRCTTVPRVD